MKKALAMTLVASMAVASVHADIVSVNFKQFAGGVNDALDGYGVAAANNWLNTQGTVGTDVAGSVGATTVNFTMTNPGGFASAPGGGVYDNTPMRTGAFVYAVPLTLSLSGLSAFAPLGYDVIVYGTGNNAAGGGNQGAYSDGTTTYYMQRAVVHNATLIQSSDINSGDGVDEGNYVVFSGLSGDTQSITLTTVNGNTGLGGFQIVAIPEPATLGMVAVFGGGILLIRRKFTF